MARYCILLSRLCIEGESKVLVRCTIALPHVTGRGAPLQGSFARRGRRDLFAGPVFVCDAWTRATPKRGTYCPASASNCGPRPTKTRSYRPASASCRGLCHQGSFPPAGRVSRRLPISRGPRLPGAGRYRPAFASSRGLRRTVSVSIRGPRRPASAFRRGPHRTVFVSIRSPRRPASAFRRGSPRPAFAHHFSSCSSADLPAINSMSKSHGDNCHRIKRPGRWHGDNCHQNKLWFTNEYGTFLRPRRCINNQLLLTIAKHRVFSPLMRHAQGRLRPVFSTASHLTVYAFRTGVAGRARLRFSPVPARVRAPPYRLTVGL